MEEEGVSFVERVDLASVGNSDVGVSEDEFSDTLQFSKERFQSATTSGIGQEVAHVIESVTVDTLSSRNDQVGGRTVHAVTSYLQF